jgi:hypothetical protein
VIQFLSFRDTFGILLPATTGKWIADKDRPERSPLRARVNRTDQASNAPESKRGAAEICVLHGQRRKRANFKSVSTSAIVSTKRIRLMRRAGFLFFAFLLTALPELRAEKIDNRNFAFDSCYPTPNEIQLAEQRARKYWAKNAERFGSNPFYLAVRTSNFPERCPRPFRETEPF